VALGMLLDPDRSGLLFQRAVVLVLIYSTSLAEAAGLIARGKPAR
jgi:hypothetical protein